jgi:hypothetical protein
VSPFQSTLTRFLTRWTDQLDADDFPIGVKVSNQHLAPRGLIRHFTAMMRLLLNEANVADLLVNRYLLAWS